MSKYILTLLLCLSSHTLAATDHTQPNQSSLEEEHIITQSSENATPLPSTTSAETDQTKEISDASSTSFHKEQPTTDLKQKKWKPSFWKSLFGYFGLTLLTTITGVGIIFGFLATSYLTHGNLFRFNYWRKEKSIPLLLLLLTDIGFSLSLAYFYTKSQKPYNHSFLKRALEFFAFCIVGSLAALVVIFLIPKNMVLALIIPFIMILVSSIIGAKRYVDSFHKPHKEKAEEKQAIKSVP